MLGWGSNRALELGLREDVRMVLRPEVIKTVRGVNVVQVASSPVATGEKLFFKKKKFVKICENFFRGKILEVKNDFEFRLFSSPNIQVSLTP